MQPSLRLAARKGLAVRLRGSARRAGERQMGWPECSVARMGPWRSEHACSGGAVHTLSGVGTFALDGLRPLQISGSLGNLARRTASTAAARALARSRTQIS